MSKIKEKMTKSKFNLKSAIVIVICLVGFVVFTGCEKEEDKNATAKVEVTKNGQEQVGVTVYMFTSQQDPNTVFFTPFHSRRQSITESDGVATFKLRDTFDLAVIDKQTTFYFGVFEGNTVLGQTALTIEKGETKTVKIRL